MINLLIAAGTGFVVSVLGTPFLIRLLRARGIGQAIRDDGPIEHPHVRKAGTPTMGGVAIVGAATAGYLVAHLRSHAFKHANSGLALMMLILGMALLGFIDDYLGVRAHRNLGLRKRGKLLGQIVVGTGFVILALNWVHVSTQLSFTRRMALDMGPWGWGVVAVFVILATSNGVNLTDGMDGLAAGASALVFSAFVVIAFVQFRHPHQYHSLAAASLDHCVIAGAMMGACTGFLWWNAAPAQIFMGDTGALALGGAVAGLALLTHTILLLPILGGLYVVETMSLIAQVVAFRGFGRRVLRMSPIHHHFEVGGWPEFTVVVRFWLFAGMCVALGLGLFYADFLRIPGVIE
ncbi:MAG TPA: phospho-N-acetylmuramoyl-pentapeptide-transferase [Acidimicrobiia bacterium]|nr:phospho-N-acetylmuramoyl-pentapeptide-transferase [Acidimicrobiia bacterium]